MFRAGGLLAKVRDLLYLGGGVESKSMRALLYPTVSRALWRARSGGKAHTRPHTR